MKYIFKVSKYKEIYTSGIIQIKKYLFMYLSFIHHGDPVKDEMPQYFKNQVIAGDVSRL